MISLKIIPIKCPKCHADINFGDNKGDWSTFVCPSCHCLFSIANSDIRDETPIVEGKVPPFNPSERFIQ